MRYLVLAALMLGVHAPLWTPPPVVPPGHVPVAAREERPPARAEDVRSIEAVLGAYYDAISGPTGEPREWERFASLFVDGATLVTSSTAAAGGAPLIMTPDQFAKLNDEYFEGSGYDERSVHQRIVSFGHVAHVFSTYESRRQNNADPYSRGVNSFQLIESGGRWWIVSVAWDREQGETRLGREHLPPVTSKPAPEP